MKACVTGNNGNTDLKDIIGNRIGRLEGGGGRARRAFTQHQKIQKKKFYPIKSTPFKLIQQSTKAATPNTSFTYAFADP